MRLIDNFKGLLFDMNSTFMFGEDRFHYGEDLHKTDSRSIKPSPRLYQEALHGAGVQPQEALFIGDSLRYDVEGAKKVGMTTIWVTSQPASHPCVDHIIQVIQELETYVAQLRLAAGAATHRPHG
ncbi:MAG: HAD family hydrolase [Acidobacteria bacterium]|nr:HAD family hydrolase [Acidobacteriota bacterium]MCI0722454.1 HAD family hydrolase [Acidobacteriota bacterium]